MSTTITPSDAIALSRAMSVDPMAAFTLSRSMVPPPPTPPPSPVAVDPSSYFKQALVYARGEMARYAHFQGWTVGYCMTKTETYQVNWTRKTMKLSKYLVQGISNVRLFARHMPSMEIVCPGGDIEKLQIIIENMLVMALSNEFHGKDEDEMDNMAGMMGTVEVKVKGVFAPQRTRYCNRPGCMAKIQGYRFPHAHKRVHRDCGGKFLLKKPQEQQPIPVNI